MPGFDRPDPLEIADGAVHPARFPSERLGKPLGVGGPLLARHHPVRQRPRILAGAERHERLVKVHEQRGLRRVMSGHVHLAQVTAVLQIEQRDPEIIRRYVERGREVLKGRHRVDGQRMRAGLDDVLAHRDRSRRPALQPAGRGLDIAGGVAERRLAAHAVQAVHQPLEVRLARGIDLEEQHRLQEGRELCRIEVDDERHEPALATDLLDEADVDLLCDPRLGDRLLGQHHDEMGHGAEALLHLLPKTIARLDLPFVEPDVDAVRHQIFRDRTHPILVLARMRQIDFGVRGAVGGIHDLNLSRVDTQTLFQKPRESRRAGGADRHPIARQPVDEDVGMMAGLGIDDRGGRSPRLLLERLHAERDRLGLDVGGKPAGVERPAIVGELDHWLWR